MQDTLYLLEPGFPDPKLGDASWYCPSCAQLEGLLAHAPALRERLQVVRLAFARPRQMLVELLGEAHQSCPVLVLGGGEGGQPAPTGKRFIAGAGPIAEYLAQAYGTPRPHP